MEANFEVIELKTKKLCAEFNTVKAEQKKWVDVRDNGIVHESTGKYVTESTAGFFPNKTVPAYKLISLFPKLLNLHQKHDEDLFKEIEGQFGEGLWEGFSDPTEEKIRKKKKGFRSLRLGVKASEYNDILADIYDAGKELTQQAQEDKDKIGEQIFGTIMNLACVASDAEVDPYLFDVDFQKTGLEFAEKAIRRKFYIKF